MHAGVWAIGEYGDVLVRNEVVDPEEQQLRVTEQNVLDLLESIIRSPYTSDTGREYVMTALMKLSTRFPNSQEYVGHAPARTQDCMHACMHGHGADPALSGMRCTGASAPSCRASPAARASSCSSVPPSTSPSSASTAFGACRRIPLAALVDRLPRSPAVLIAAHPALILCEQLGLAGAHADPGAARGQPPDPPCWRYGGLAPSATGLNWGPLNALGARLIAAADRIRGRGWPDTVPGSGWVGLARGVPPGGCGVAGAWRSLRDERVQNAWLTWAVASSVGVSVARLQASAAANLLELDLLGDGPSAPAPAAQPRSAAPAASGVDDLMSLFGGGGSGSSAPVRNTAQAGMFGDGLARGCNPSRSHAARPPPLSGRPRYR